MSSRRRGKRTYYLLFRKQMFGGDLSRDYIIFKLDYSPGRPSCIHKGIPYDLDLSRSRQPSQLQSLCERNPSQVGCWTSRLTIARLGRIHRKIRNIEEHCRQRILRDVAFLLLKADRFVISCPSTILRY